MNRKNEKKNIRKDILREIIGSIIGFVGVLVYIIAIILCIAFFPIIALGVIVGIPTHSALKYGIILRETKISMHDWRYVTVSLHRDLTKIKGYVVLCVERGNHPYHARAESTIFEKNFRSLIKAARIYKSKIEELK